MEIQVICPSGVMQPAAVISSHKPCGRYGCRFLSLDTHIPLLDYHIPLLDTNILLLDTHISLLINIYIINQEKNVK
jgi:hypothetical protein